MTKAESWAGAASIVLLCSFQTCVGQTVDHSHGKPGFELYTVRPNDTLFGIASQYLQEPVDWMRLKRINGVSNPRDLKSFRVLRVPAELVRHDPLTAHVVALRGVAERGAAGGPFSPLQPGVPLTEGDQIRTGDDSSLSILLSDGSNLVLPSNSTMELRQLHEVPMTGAIHRKLELQKGEVETGVTPLRRPGDTFEIISPSIIASVRGTHFRVQYIEASKATAVEVTGGTVAVERPVQSKRDSGPGPSQHTEPLDMQFVHAGFGNVTGVADSVGAPVRLLPAPELNEPGRVQNQAQLIFNVRPLADAVAYRVQIARDAGFLELLGDRRSTPPQIRFDELADGLYFVRFSAIDQRGLEGLAQTYGFERRKMGTISPTGDPLSHDGAYEFRWMSDTGELTTGEPTTRYRFVLSTSPDLAARILDVADIVQTRLTVSHLQPGRYYWTVTAEQFENGKYYSRTSAVESFVIGQ
ncbi:FecR domain-containing protein [Paraburkholderia sp. BR14263]|uniref:FecR domain-containing protein n=1 Tax=unclassified Paraburkholderia TaxID=2615204 RepID=UPI0034CE8ACC